MKKIYLKPESKPIMLKVKKMIAASNLQVFTTTVNASEAGARRGYDVWDDNENDDSNADYNGEE